MLRRIVLFVFVLGLFALPAPAQSTPIGLANGTPHSTSFTWTASAPVTGVTVSGYNLYCAPTTGKEANTNAVNGATLISGTSYTDLAVTSGATQFCVVSAQASNGNQSAFSNEVSFTTPSNPNPPTGLTIPVVALNITKNKETMSASWQDVPGSITGYVVWNGSKVLKEGIVTDSTNTGTYSVSWSGAKQPSIYVQVFDIKTADQPVS
jgi:hypothetical protein